MFCTNCGNSIDRDDKFCPYCGKKQDSNYSRNSFFTDDSNQNEQNLDNSRKTTNNSTTRGLYNSLYYNGLFYSAISFLVLTFSPVVSLIVSCLGLRYLKKNPNYEDKLISKILNITLIVISLISACFSISKLIVTIYNL